jgi:hypothetical protein
MGDRHERVRNAQPIGTEARRLIPTSLDQAHFDERAGYRVGRGGRATLKGTLLLTSIVSKAGIEAVLPREGSSPFYLTFFTLTSGLPLPLAVPVYHGCAPNQSGYWCNAFGPPCCEFNRHAGLHLRPRASQDRETAENSAIRSQEQPPEYDQSAGQQLIGRMVGHSKANAGPGRFPPDKAASIDSIPAASPSRI